MLVFCLAMIPLYFLRREREELERKYKAEFKKITEDVEAWVAKLEKIVEDHKNERKGG